ncbi:hypothetical protein ACFXGI_16810 [Streptomyces sp. NPDC059355]|uniref:hypothetical protein n=1 Tax=Streptomyces sp. NPDC059355 TaxID=3346811 RepID=UPI00368A74D4
MPRLPRYLLIWLSCTAASVTAVLATVQFVVGSTRHTPPVARSAPTVIETPPAWQAGTPAPSTPSPSASASPSPSATQKPSPSAASPTPAKAPRTNPSKSSVDCAEGGAGLYTVPSQGGKVTVRYGSRGVCLISAVPDRGFKTTTSQSEDDTLTVTFTSADHRSVVTATIDPSAKATVRESSL